MHAIGPDKFKWTLREKSDILNRLKSIGRCDESRNYSKLGWFGLEFDSSFYSQGTEVGLEGLILAFVRLS